MEAESETQSGTFDWKIENFHEVKYERIQSPIFKLRTDECLLRIYGRRASCSKCRNSASPVYLKSLKNFAFDQETSYTLCLITPNNEFLLTTRSPLNTNSTSLLPLTIIEDFDFVNTEYLFEGTLHLRLTWDEEKEQETKTMPENKPLKCLKTLSADFSRFYESKMDTDCVLRLGGVQFSVHRKILATRSEVFGAMFRHDTSESRSGVVDISDVDAAILGDVLHYVYSGQIRGLTPLTAVPMFAVADKYALIELRDICLGFLKRNLMIENVCEAAVLAHVHEDMDLENKIVLFIEEKLEELEKTAEWQNFSKTETLLANRLIRSALMACRKKKLSGK